MMSPRSPWVSAGPRERILEAATRLFSREGIQAVGINRIVTEANVAPMTLYRHFSSKDELVAASLEHWSAQWLQWLADEVDRSSDNSRASFADLWDALEAWHASNDFRGSFIANAAIEFRGDPDHPVRKVIAEHAMMTRQLLEDAVKRAGARNPADLAAQLQLLVDGTLTLQVIDHRLTAMTNARALADLALAANRVG
jgi:AcrR family transcriptional regulator